MAENSLDGVELLPKNGDGLPLGRPLRETVRPSRVAPQPMIEVSKKETS